MQTAGICKIEPATQDMVGNIHLNSQEPSTSKPTPPDLAMPQKIGKIPFKKGKPVPTKQCEFCGLKFNHQNTLSQHKWRQHLEKMQQLHPEKPQNFRAMFLSQEDFDNWQTDGGVNLKMGYFKNTGDRVRAGKVVQYYSCSYSGTRTPKNSNLRKNRDSFKTGTKCSSFFIVSRWPDGKILVEGHTEHTGHGDDLSKKRLSPASKDLIATLLFEGKSNMEIREIFRKAPDSEIIGKKDINARDILNVALKFKWNQERRQKSRLIFGIKTELDRFQQMVDSDFDHIDTQKLETLLETIQNVNSDSEILKNESILKVE